MEIRKMNYSHAFVSLYFRSLGAPKASILLSSINIFTMRDTCTIVQTEGRTSSLFECYAEVLPILYKDIHYLRDKYDSSHKNSTLNNSTSAKPTIQHSTLKTQNSTLRTIQNSTFNIQHCASRNHPLPRISHSALSLPPCAMPLLVSGIHT